MVETEVNALVLRVMIVNPLAVWMRVHQAVQGGCDPLFVFPMCQNGGYRPNSDDGQVVEPGGKEGIAEQLVSGAGHVASGTESG